MVEKENPDYKYMYSDLKLRLRELFKTMDNMRCSLWSEDMELTHECIVVENISLASSIEYDGTSIPDEEYSYVEMNGHDVVKYMDEIVELHLNEINMAKLNEITIRTEIKTSEEGRSIDKVLMLERFKKALKTLEIWYDFEGQPINLDD